MKKSYAFLLAAAMILPLAGCSAGTPKEKPAASSAASVQQEKTTETKIYLPTDDYLNIRPVTVKITGSDLPKAALEELLKSDRSSQYPLLPKDLKVLGVTVQNGVATVDFSEELKALSGGSTSEEIFIAMVTDTLTEFASIKTVKFHVAGRPVAHLSGHMDMTKSFGRNESIIKK